ncbi:MAG: acyl-CoA dehydratase activase [Nitrospiraceae bacterium]|nr:acyl-CoA dehydratase activase [Nitrospiraceae bacterium]
MIYAGLDAGSVSVKLVLLDEKGAKLCAYYEKHGGRPLEKALDIISRAGLDRESETSLRITGGAGRLIARILGLEPLNEVVAQAASTLKLHPRARSIIELGGEDSKLIILTGNPGNKAGDRKRGIADFAMNSVCAAGTGSFLDQQAERLNLTIEEFSGLALKSERPPRIAGRCSVFAKSDMIHLQQIATPVEDIVAGLCFAVARNFKGSIMRGRTLPGPVAFQGGVAANQGMVRAFREVLGIEDLFVPEDFALMGAWGAALKASEEKKPGGFDLNSLREFIRHGNNDAGGHRPLIVAGDGFAKRHLPNLPAPAPDGTGPGAADEEAIAHAGNNGGSGRKRRAWLGIDIGSISTNLALIDDSGRVLAKRYLMTAGRPIEAVREGLRGIGSEAGRGVFIAGVGTTGSGRYMIADFVGADIVKNEITAQAAAAAFIEPDVDTIFEIGGQDSKYISLRDGVIVDFEMNKACAAGTGSFLEEQAEKLNISVKDEYARCAFGSGNPLKLGERCTVFMENSLMANLGRGAQKDDLLAGLAYSIVQNYINRVVAAKPIGQKILFQGGVAFNKAVVAAFEKFLGRQVVVPPHHDVTGAIGMALIAKKELPAIAGRNAKGESSFKGFELSERGYRVSSFQCKGCPNVCEINRVKIEGEEGHLSYGGRCEKYDIRRKKAAQGGPENLFKFREEQLWGPHLARPDNAGPKQGGPGYNALPGRPAVGLPYIFYFEDQLPFWSVFLRECGLGVEVSPKTNREIINLGLESVLSEACFPVKVAHGHIGYLAGKGLDAIFIPSFINLNNPGGEFRDGQACPETQTIPYVAAVAIKGLKGKLIAPPVDFSRGRGHLLRVLRDALGRRFGIKAAVLGRALEQARAAQALFEGALVRKGREVLSGLSGRTVVVIGRSYNAFDPGMNLEIPEKLAALGVPSIPMDLLPLDDMDIAGTWPQVYWRSGQRILKAARLIKANPHLFPVFLGNFSCGPDSFVLKYLKRELEGEKPFLHIEIDEHSADAGALTRLEAFLDSLSGWEKTARSAARPAPADRAAPAVLGKGKKEKRTIYLPRMSDHVFALKAALERTGARAEVLPPSDAKTLEYGARFVSGKECYPYMVTTGDMLKKVYSADFRPEESAFFMPGGTGPCRFGQYNVFHKQVLDSIGLSHVPIFAPNQDKGFYEDLGIVGRDFPLNAWKGIVAIELLMKCLHETRPYETRKGAAAGLYEDYLRHIEDAVRGANGGLEKVLARMARDFAALSGRGSGGRPARPLIGVVGEIFVRSSRFSNEDLVSKIEALGGEVWLAPVEEWIYYVNLTGLRKARVTRDVYSFMQISMKQFFQKKIEHRLRKPFMGMLRSLPEPGTKDILEKARPYVHDSFEGETVLSIGKAVDLAGRGVAGIVNAMPFGCMPGTIVTALLRGVSGEFGVPAISVPYDGTESATTMLQLEAFMDQAKDRAQGRNGH